MLRPYRFVLYIAALLALAAVAACGQLTPIALSPTPTATLPTPSPAPAPATPTPVPTATPAPSPTPTPAPRTLSLLTEVIAAVQDSVVQIKTPDGSGTGFILTSEGLVLTNAHVVGTFIRVHILAEGLGIVGGQGIVAEVIGVDHIADLALISLEPRSGGYPHVTLADSDLAVLGEDVVAIGYPLGPVLGKGITVTRGIVSSRRHVNGIEYIQTDAALNPGSSGGPLFNMDGEVLGINTVRLEENENRAVQGIAFAISSNSVKKLLMTLLPLGMSLE